MKIHSVVQLILHLAITLISTFVTYTILPRYNAYYFPRPNDIDRYTYIDDNNVCYRYKRIYNNDIITS